MESLKNKVMDFWNETPCSLRNKGANSEGSKESFQLIAEDRYQGDSFMKDVVPFHAMKGLKTLEVGCGLGTDLVQFAKAEANTYALDLSKNSLYLAKQNLANHNLSSKLIHADAENIPYEDASFDLIYSWGCLHHTETPEKAFKELYRILKPGGKILIMLYHKYSLVTLQAYLLYGLFKGKPFCSLDEILANHIESPGTKAYSMNQIKKLFAAFTALEVKPIITRYDLRYGRFSYLPSWVGKCLPPRWGWNLIISGEKLK